MHSLLSVHNLSKNYDSMQALEATNLTVYHGEIIALVGGNGAGKSTLLELLAGMTTPSSGTVTYSNETFYHPSKHVKHNIGFMPDDFQFQEPISVYEWLSFFATLRQASHDDIHHMLHTVGLNDKQFEKVTSLSKGMRQRLLFAQADVTHPKLLLLDEPTNGLDPYWISSLMNQLQTLKKADRTAIFSTHDLFTAADVSDRIMFMDRGVIKTIFYPNERDSTPDLVHTIHEHLLGKEA